MTNNRLGKKTNDDRMNLAEIKQGQDARIISVGGDLRLRRRILEMGLTRGVDVHVEKYAPLQDPMELVVRGNHISLRVREAAEILVELI